jgi:hypothetical protein
LFIYYGFEFKILLSGIIEEAVKPVKIQLYRRKRAILVKNYDMWVGFQRHPAFDVFGGCAKKFFVDDRFRVTSYGHDL